jgi:hypothetical protein
MILQQRVLKHLNVLDLGQDYIHKAPVSLHDNLQRSLTNLTVLLPQSRDWSYDVGRKIPEP